MDTQKKWILMFSGQGSPAIGMGNRVCDIDDTTREIWDCACDISGIDLRQLNQKGPMPKLMKTRYQQLLITVINVAYLSQLKTYQIQDCSAVVGHSAGEYSALYAANVISLETLFELINQRALIMQQIAEKQKCLMYNVRNASVEHIQQCVQRLCLSKHVFIACDNGLHQVIAGQEKAVKEVCHALMREGKDAVKLGVNGAWHTPIMHDGVNDMRMCLAKYPFQTPNIPLLMNNTGLFTQDIKQIKENLSLHLENCVQFCRSLQQLITIKPSVILEIGHKKCLTYLCQDFYQQENHVAFQPHYEHINDLLSL